ncbi:MAG: hypothetical protein QM538_05485 [Methylacidiphilales bacterium]|nr:hypothetical protein [Candidatus Methylacidiphilales bacterium]
MRLSTIFNSENNLKYFSISLVCLTIIYICYVLISRGNFYPFDFFRPIVFWPGGSLYGDIKIIKPLALMIQEGLDPYVVPNGTFSIPLTYPPIWIWIAQSFQLHIDWHFYTFVSIYIFIFIGILLYFMMKGNSGWYLLLFFSTPSLLGIDRGTSDILVFDLLFLVAVLLCTKNIYAQWLAGIPLLFAGAIKYFPFVGILAFRKTALVFALSALAGFYLYYYFDYLTLGIKLTQYPELILAYGATIFFNNSKVFVLGFLIITAQLLYLVSKKYLTFYSIINSQNSTLDFNQTLYVLGASCYCLSFLSHGNWDYRLVVLFLCFPLLLQNKNLPLVRFILILHVVIFFGGLYVYVAKEITQTTYRDSPARMVGTIMQFFKLLIWYFHAIILLKYAYSNWLPSIFKIKMEGLWEKRRQRIV